MAVEGCVVEIGLFGQLKKSLCVLPRIKGEGRDGERVGSSREEIGLGLEQEFRAELAESLISLRNKKMSVMERW